MADKVEIPVSLTVEDIDMSSITDTRFKKELGKLKKEFTDVFNNSKSIQNISKKFEPVKNVFSIMSRASKETMFNMDKAAQKAWKSSEAYKEIEKHNAAIDKQINDVKEAFAGFGIAAKPQLDEAIKQLEAQKKPMEMPEGFGNASALKTLQDRMSSIHDDMVAVNAEYSKLNKNRARLGGTSGVLQKEIDAINAEIDAKRKELERVESTPRVGPATKENKAKWEEISHQAEQYRLEITFLENDLNKYKGQQESVNDKIRETETKMQGLADKSNQLSGEMTKVKGATEKLKVLNAIGAILPKIGAGFSAIGRAILGAMKNMSLFSKHGHKSTMSLSKGFNKLKRNILMFGLGFRSAYFLIKRLRQIFIQEMGKMAKESDAINIQMSNLVQSFRQFKATVVTAIQPIASVFIPILTDLFNKFSLIAEKVANFNANLMGKKTVMKATTAWQDYATSVDKANQKLGSYDKLEVISQQDPTTYEEVPTEELTEQQSELMLALQNVGQAFKDLWAEIQPKLAELVQMLQPIAVLVLNTIATVVRELTPAISAIVSAIKPIIESILPVLSTVIPVIADIISTFVQMVAPVIVSLFQQIMPVIQKIAMTILPALQKILLALQPVFDVLVETVLPFLLDIIDALMPLVQGLLDAVTAILTPILALLKPLLELVVAILQPLLDILRPILDVLGSVIGVIGALVGQLIERLGPVIESLKAFLAPLLAQLGTFVPALDAIADAVKWVLNIFMALADYNQRVFMKGFQKLADLMTLSAKSVTDNFGKVREGLADSWKTAKNIFNSILGGFETLVNGVIRGINTMVNALNKLSFNVPDWIPGIGGKSFGFNLATVREISIPRLAQGAVIPPNKEFLAQLGDQRHGTNIEAPLDTIKQALAEVLAEMKGTNEPIVLQLDGKTIAQVVWNESEKKYKQTGKMAYSY